MQCPGSLYIHFPFCRQRCHYCDFSLVRSSHPPVDDWLRAIEYDLTEWFADNGWERPVSLETIYIGGGTPSLLGVAGMEELASRLLGWFSWNPDQVEWTAEANPSSLSMAVCEGWRAIGVNRLSVGVQSFDDGVLNWLGRWHDAREAAEALGRARAAGFANVNADLMFGLPADVPRDWRREVETAVDLGVTHVSAYGLTVEPRTALGRWVELGRRPRTDDDTYAAEYLLAAELLGDAGLRQYEVSNFARPKHESAHNWHYWDGSGYLGIGPSAHSFLPPYRVWNVDRWAAYRNAVQAGTSVRAGREERTRGQVILERAWLDLRTRRGIGDEDLEALGPDARDRVEGRWSDENWIRRDGERWRLTPSGWLLLDRLAVELTEGTVPPCEG